MTTCENCSFYFPVSENEGDYKPGRGDCVTEKEDAKGKYWLSRPTTNATHSCPTFKKSK
jgi:hypothetical protein